LSDKYSKHLRHAYYASISYVDAQVGKVLDKLETTGLAENTMVIIWGDHGWHLGDHTAWGKHTLFERSLKSTLIIKIPEMEAPGISTMSMVESIDLYPTIMEFTGTHLPDSLDGISLMPVIRDPEQAIKSETYGYFKQGISVRTDRYRFSVYRRNSGVEYELFDHKTDPLETINVAEQQPEVVKRLIPLLEKGDTGLYD